MATKTTKPMKKGQPAVLTDNDDIKVVLLKPTDADIVRSGGEVDEDVILGDVKITAVHVEKIKAIIECEDTIKFHKTTISDMKKALVTDLNTDAGFVSELISVVRKEMDPEGGGAIEKKTRVLSAAEQCVVMYPNVEVKASTIAAVEQAQE